MCSCSIFIFCLKVESPIIPKNQPKEERAMKKILSTLILSIAVAGCATTKNLEEMATIDIGGQKSIPVRFQVQATAFKDTLFIDIKGEQKFKFEFSMSNLTKTLQEEIGYNGNSLKAACKLDTSSKKTTLSYTAHNCSIYVNGDQVLQREF